MSFKTLSSLAVDRRRQIVEILIRLKLSEPTWLHDCIACRTSSERSIGAFRFGRVMITFKFVQEYYPRLLIVHIEETVIFNEFQIFTDFQLR
jgi:hypothetical protein